MNSTVGVGTIRFSSVYGVPLRELTKGTKTKMVGY